MTQVDPSEQILFFLRWSCCCCLACLPEPVPPASLWGLGGMFWRVSGARPAPHTASTVPRLSALGATHAGDTLGMAWPIRTAESAGMNRPL